MKYIIAVVACLLAFISVNAGTDLVINWLPNPPGESNQLYRVYVATNSTTVFALAGGTTDTTFVVSNIITGTYGVSITASNIWGENAMSPPVYGAGPFAIPSTVTGVNVFIRVQ